MKFFKHLEIINNRLDRHHTFMLASGIAFNLIIYMIPLFLLVIYLVQQFFDTQGLIHTLEKLLNDYMPRSISNKEIIHTIMDELLLITKHAAFFGWIGLAGLLWISSALVSSIRTSLNTIFDIQTQKFFLVYWIKDIFLTIIISILIMIYSYAIPIVNFILELLNSFTPTIFEGFFSSIVLFLASIITSFLLFIFIYYFVPNKKLPKLVILYSTIISVVGIELSRYIFAWYITSISNYGKFYGTYAVIVSMAVWIYYSAVIILLAAEISKYIYDHKNFQIPELTQNDVAK